LPSFTLFRNVSAINMGVLSCVVPDKTNIAGNVTSIMNILFFISFVSFPINVL